MKKILITGANSYIGTSFENYLKEKYPNKYIIDTIDMFGDNWKTTSFSGYDSIFHVAGIAHSDNGKISSHKEKMYYAVNTELTIAVAKKAKDDGVGQFIFMSSAIVYGNSARIGKKKIITKETPVNPANCYGDSKVQAENGLRNLNDETFKVVILRCPMIYGKGSKGNYLTLAKLAQKFPIFPYVDNQRSMLYIENLCAFVLHMISREESGIFWPQNNEYSNTCDMIRLIANAHGKRVKFVKGWTWLLKLAGCFIQLVNKAFGNLVYDKTLSEYSESYSLYSLEQSIKKIEEIE